MLLLQSSDFDPTDYGQENYMDQLNAYQGERYQEYKDNPNSDPFKRVTEFGDITSEFAGYRQGKSDFDEFGLGAVDYGDSIDATQNLDYMEDLLKEMAGEGGVADRFRSHAYTGIGKSFDKARESADESIAQAGLGRSGLGSAVDVEIGAGEAEAKTGVDVQAEQIEADINFKVINQLLGIDQTRLQAGQFDIGVKQGEQMWLRDLYKFEEQMAFQREQFKWEQEQAEFDFWRDLATPLLTGAVSGYAGRSTRNYY